jgi:hypothetical protein
LRALIAAVLALMAAGVAEARDSFKKTTPITVTAEPFSLNGHQRGGKIGKLRWLCGLVLRSDAPQFGGFSGLAISKDGGKLLAITDEGAWLAADLPAANGCPTSLANARMGPLLAANGKPLAPKRLSDSEGLAVLRTGDLDGSAYISFERRHRIMRYTLRNGEITGAPQAVFTPQGVKLGPNKGMEAVAVLQGGPFKGAIIAFAEDGEGAAPGWLIVSGKAQALSIRLHGGFKITDAAALDDGGLLVLERYYQGFLSGVYVRVRHIRADGIKPGAVLDGEVLLETGGYSGQVDNMEGAAVHMTADGAVLTIVSDDNFNPMQRTLLMQFLLPKP